jgi:hypothetical protein
VLTVTGAGGNISVIDEFEKALVLNTDYTVNSGTVTIAAAYLTALDNGEYSFTVTSGGQMETVAITVSG